MYRPVARGLFRVQDDRDGRLRAPSIAQAGRSAAEHAAGLRSLILDSPAGRRKAHPKEADAYVHAVTHTRDQARAAHARAQALSEQRQRLVRHWDVRRDLAALARSVGPREYQEVLRWLTAPQQALWIKAREAVRQIALGVER
jgi:hypothetical protein